MKSSADSSAFENVKKKKKKERQTRRVFPVGTKSFCRLLNLERDIPKEGELGDDPLVEGQLRRGPLWPGNLSLVTRGDF